VIGEVAAMLDERSLAVSLYESYVEMMVGHYGSTHLAVSDAYAQLSRLHTSFGQIMEALEAAEKAAVLRLGRLGKDHPSVADARYNIGVIHLLLGSSHDAHREFTAALETYITPGSEEAANLQHGLAMAEHQLGAHESAHGHYHQAKRIRQVLHGNNHQSVLEIDRCLAALQVDTDERMARTLKKVTGEAADASQLFRGYGDLPNYETAEQSNWHAALKPVQ